MKDDHTLEDLTKLAMEWMKAMLVLNHDHPE